MHQRRIHNQEELTIIQESKALRSCEGLRHTPLVLEYLSPLLSCITPTIRPVDSLLLTTKEKRELAHITELMMYRFFLFIMIIVIMVALMKPLNQQEV